MSIDLTGLPAKPALRHLFMFDWYRSQYGAVPKRRGKALSRVYRWWDSLPKKQRSALTDRAAREIGAYNDRVRRERAEFMKHRAELLARIQRHLGEPLS